MSHIPSNYQQNYQNYYPEINEQYDDYYEDEVPDLGYDDTQDLQVPNSRLYPEGYSDITELYARNALYAETQQRVENNNMQYRHEYDPEPNDYYYNVSQLQQHRTRVPRAQCSTLQSTSNYPYHHHHSLYTACPLATTALYHHHDDNINFIPEKTGKSTNKTAKVMGVHSCVGASNLQEIGDDYNVELYHEGQGKKKVYHYRKNYDDYNADGVRYESKKNPEVYMNYQGKKFCVYGGRVGKNGGMKKYPVTVKTPKYVSKSQMMPPLNKRPSALCLPVVTQPDPGLVKRKSKTHQEKVKKTYDQSEPLPQNTTGIPDNYTYAAHQMDSEGDMNSNAIAKGLEHLLDQYETDVVLNENQATTTNEEDGSGETKHKIKEFSKFLKPRVPSSIKAKQEKIAKLKSSVNTTGSSIQPKMKISLDKLLNRLQKCEIVESTDKLSENSYRSKKEGEEEKSKGDNDKKKRSFNYDTLTRKLSPTVQDKKQKEQNKSLLNKPSTSVTTSLDNNRSSRMIALDDNCALDLHRSKSYIVDLIDRALSKELGTIPRGQSIHHEMTTKQAVKTISRHRQSRHKELCYEVTAALTDSFISNATAPQNQPRDVELKRSQSDDNEIKNKLCASFGDDVNYIKQLKQLRWGHIRHIQHEARKLADLEEFLEKCGEIEF